MSDQPERPKGPDLTRGVALADFRDRKLLGHVGDDSVLLVQCDNGDVRAIGALCTHYKGPLVDGLVVGRTVRCPWHHSCFDADSGEAVRPPAFDPVGRWEVERTGDRLIVRNKVTAKLAPRDRGRRDHPESIVIIGGGAAGLTAADTLRREGYDGPITIFSADDAAPYDRPNLSKDYL